MRHPEFGPPKEVLSELTRRLSRLARHAPWHAATHAALSAAQRTGLPCDTRAETAKLGAVAAGGRWAAAWAYLRRQLGGGLQPDAAMLNVLLSSSTESGWRQGLQLLQIFLEKSIGLTARTAMKVIPLVSWPTARELLIQMRRQVEMNVVVCNAALAAGVLDLKHFDHWKVEPDLISLNTASDLLVKAGRWQQAQQALQCLEDVGIERDTLSLNIQLSACPWRAAAAIAAQGTGLQLDLVSFSSTMAACERFSAWLPALQIFQDQRHHDIAPDLIAYNSVTSACCKGESWSSGLHFFSDILTAENSSVEVAGTAVLAACKRNEEWPCVWSFCKCSICDVQPMWLPSQRLSWPVERGRELQSAKCF